MTKFPLLIALAGAAGAGKNAAGMYLKQAHGFARYRFTQPLYDAVQSLYGVTAFDLIEDRHEAIPHLGKSPLALMQSLGDHVRREFGADFLVQRMAQRAVARGDWNNNDIVITDLRLEIEVHWIRMMGGHIWWLEAPELPGVPAHHTEQVASLRQRFFSRDMDELIKNTSSPEAFYRELDARLKWAQTFDAAADRRRPPSPTAIPNNERASA